MDRSKIFETYYAIPGELWKNIRGYRGQYQISNLGRVRIFETKKSKPKIVRQYLSQYGDWLVLLRKRDGIDYKITYELIFQLVKRYFKQDWKSKSYLNEFLNEVNLPKHAYA
jgi:hypothetical protein